MVALERSLLFLIAENQAVVISNFDVGWALAQQQSVALHLTNNGALRALLGQGPTYIKFYINNHFHGLTFDSFF